MIKVCLNGARRLGEHPGLPVTPAELADAARDAVAAGAGAVHLHARDPRGAESLVAADIGAAVRAARDACPGIPVGVSTGLWITAGDERARLAAVAAWSELSGSDRPDFASVNLSEPGFATLAEALWTAGIGVEAGVWSAADAAALRASGLAGRCVRLLVEIIGGTAAEAPGAAHRILAALDGLPGQRLLHGEEDAAWPLVGMAGPLGLDTRIGLEDTLVGPAGEPVRDNAELVSHAVALLPHR